MTKQPIYNKTDLNYFIGQIHAEVVRFCDVNFIYKKPHGVLLHPQMVDAMIHHVPFGLNAQPTPDTVFYYSILGMQVYRSEDVGPFEFKIILS
jgi:hypothetical protein